MKTRNIFLTILIFLATLPTLNLKADDGHRLQLARQLSIFNAIVKDLNLFYVDSIKPEMMMNRAISAMLGHLDPYTVYYPAEKADELKMMTTGKYA